MANNRIWLVHKGTGERILLAKYYPDTKWCLYHDESTINDFFNNTAAVSMFGNTGYHLQFDVVAHTEGKDNVGIYTHGAVM